MLSQHGNLLLFAFIIKHCLLYDKQIADYLLMKFNKIQHVYRLYSFS